MSYAVYGNKFDLQTFVAPSLSEAIRAGVAHFVQVYHGGDKSKLFITMVEKEKSFSITNSTDDEDEKTLKSDDKFIGLDGVSHPLLSSVLSEWFQGQFNTAVNITKHVL